MNPLSKLTALAAVVTVALTLGSGAWAQSSQDMSLLTEQERQAFSERLQLTSSSAERAKITAEMNRIVQERRLDQRREQKTAAQPPAQN